MDLKKMSIPELQKMAEDALKLAEEKKASAKQELAASITKQIEEAGFTFDEVFPSRAAKSTKGTRAPAEIKYRHPEDPTLTWTGRGRKPRWLVEALDAGKDIESFAA